MKSTDKQLLEILQENSDIRNKELGEKLSISPGQIYSKIKKFEKVGIIKQYVALLDTELIGKSILAFINFSVNNHDSDLRNEFVQKIEKLNSVMEFFHTSGRFDFLIKARFSNLKEFRDFLVTELTCISNIGEIESQIVLEEIKNTTKIML